MSLGTFAICFISVTPLAIVLLLVLDVIFLLCSTLLAPIFKLLSLLSCGLLNSECMSEAAYGVYRVLLGMQRHDVVGMRRMRSLTQLVF